MKIITLLITISLSFQFCKAQNETLYKKMYSYFVLKGEVTDNKSREVDYSNSFVIEEVLLKDTSFSHDFGIYKFTTLLNEESGYDILIKKGEMVEFYDMSNLNFLIKNILLLKNYNTDLNDEVIVDYIEEIVNIYDENYKGDVDMAIVDKQYGNYRFYISLSNYTPIKK